MRFLSNNPTKDPDQYVDKLTRLGLPTAIEAISKYGRLTTCTGWSTTTLMLKFLQCRGAPQAEPT